MRRILAAVDESERAIHVVTKAVVLAHASGASVRVYHAVAVPQDFPAAAHTDARDLLPARLHDLAEEWLATLTVGVHDVRCERLVGESHHPAQAILDAADAFDADVIVIGSHGQTSLDRILGTTTSSVVRRSKRDVLVVHAPVRPEDLTRVQRRRG